MRDAINTAPGAAPRGAAGGQARAEADVSNVSGAHGAVPPADSQALAADAVHQAPPTHKPAPREGGRRMRQTDLEDFTGSPENPPLPATPRDALIARCEANTPAMLKELPVWLLWRLQPPPKGTKGKPKKIPVYASGKSRSGTLDSQEDRAQLVTLDAAIAALREGAGGACGLGVALGEVPGEELVLSGMDFDGCYNPDGTIDERVQDVLLAGMSYAEKSPSGAGLHVLGTGSIGTTKKDSKGLEIYSGGRFFTFTGERIGGALELADITDAAAVARARFEVEHQGAAPSQGGGHQGGAAGGGKRVGEGGRNARLSKEAFRLRKDGASVDQILIALRGLNPALCDPPLPDDELQQIARGKARIKPEAPRPPGPELPPLEAYADDMGRDSHGSSTRAAGPTATAEPEPLKRELPPAAPYPLQHLGDVLAPAARRLQEVIQAPAAICGLSVLAAASLAAQAHADVEIDGRREPLSLFALTIAKSGERKSAVDRQALKAHSVYERKQLQRERDARKAWEAEMQAYELEKKQLLSRAKGKNAVDAKTRLAELGPPPPEPPSGILLAEAPTLEGLHKLFMRGRASLGLFNDDAGDFIGGHALNRDNKAKSAAGISKLWDDGVFGRERGGDGASKHYGRRLAVHLMVQPVIAETVLGDDVLTGQGFLARCLVAQPDSTIGDRKYVEEDLSKDPHLVAYYQRMYALLEREPIYAEGTTDELEPRPLVLTPEAKRAWIAVYEAIEADMKDGKPYASITAWGSKAASMVLRVAGVLTLVDNPEAGTIQAETVQRAAALVLWHLQEALRIVGTASETPETRAAQALLDWCRKEGHERIYSQLAFQRGPAKTRTLETFDAAINVLVKQQWARPLPKGTEVDGKRRNRAWEIRGAGT